MMTYDPFAPPRHPRSDGLKPEDLVRLPPGDRERIIAARVKRERRAKRNRLNALREEVAVIRRKHEAVR